MQTFTLRQLGERFGELAREAKAGHLSLISSPATRVVKIRIAPDVETTLTLELGKLLDPGETQAIHLAHDLGCPVLQDEKRGRMLAAKHGVPVFGLPGLLVRAVEGMQDMLCVRLRPYIFCLIGVVRKLWAEPENSSLKYYVIYRF